MRSVWSVRGWLAGLLACAATAAPAAGQTPPQAPPSPAPVLTLEFDAAIARAVEKNPTIAEAATAIARAEALLEQARTVDWPTVSASVTNPTVNSSAVIQGITIQPRSQVLFGADVSMTVLAPARWAAVAQARDQVDVAKYSTADVRKQIAVAAAQAYLSVIAAKRQVDVDQRALANARAHLDYATKRFEGGVGSRVNQVRAAQEVSSEESRLEGTQLALRRSQEALGVIVVADGPVDVGAEPAFDVPATVDLAAAVSSRTDVRLETANVAAAERIVHDSGKDWFPTGTVSFDPQYITPAGLFQLASSWRLAVTFTQPVFDGGVRRATAHQREVAVQSAKLVVDVTTNQARSDIRVAQDSVQSFQRAVTSARLAADQAAEVLRITTTAFEVGATTNIEVIDAQRTARDADTTAAVAEDAVRRAKLDLLVALGRFPK